MIYTGALDASTLTGKPEEQLREATIKNIGLTTDVFFTISLLFPSIEIIPSVNHHYLICSLRLQLACDYTIS